MEAKLPFGSPETDFFIFEPIFKGLEKKKKKKREAFSSSKCFKRKNEIFLNVAKETKNGVIKVILFLKKEKKKRALKPCIV
jgi:hypothetical protein